MKPKAPRKPRTPRSPRSPEAPKRDFNFYVSFAKTWNKAKSPAEAAQQAKISQASAQALARSLRTKGVKLQKFAPTGRTALDIKALNAAL